MSDYAQINNNYSATTANYTSKQRGTGTRGIFEDVLKSKEDKSTQTQSESTEDTDYMAQLQEHMAEMLDKIKHGTIQPKIQIGAQEYTQEEWKKFLEKFDEAQEELIRQIEEEIEARGEQAEEEKAALEAVIRAEIKLESEKAVDSSV